MIRTALLLICGFIICAQSPGQAPRWQWARSGRGQFSGYCEGWRVTTDGTNNVIITGTFGGSTYYFDNDSVLCNCDLNIGSAFFVTKYDSSGNFIWAKGPNKTSISEQSIGLAVKSGPYNRVYLTGTFLDDSLIIDSFILPNAQNTYQIYTICFDSAGNSVWAKGLYGGNEAQQNDIAADDYGNLYGAGTFNDTTRFGPLTLTTEGTAWPTAFIAKYDSAGNELWMKAGSYRSVATAIATLSGGFVVTGWFSGDSLRFGNIILHGFDSACNTIYTIRFDSLGNVVWAQASGGKDYAQSYGITVDRQDNVYITGVFISDSITFGPYTLRNSIPGGYDNTLFIVKYNAMGQVQWVKGSKLNRQALGYSIAADEFGNVYVSGGMGYDNVDALSIDSTTLLPPPGSYDPMFVLSMDSNGNLLCAEILTSGGDDQNAICVDRTGNAIIAGDYLEPTFNIAGSDFTLSSQEDVFVAKFACGDLGCTPPPVSVTINGDTLIANNGTAFQWYLNGNPLPGATGNRLIDTQEGNYTVRITDSIGCSSISNPVTLGIDDLVKDVIKVFPNPTVNVWWFTVPDNLVGSTFGVYDSRGQIIYQSIISSTQSEIELPLPGGVYFLHVMAQQGLLVKKLVKL